LHGTLVVQLVEELLRGSSVGYPLSKVSWPTRVSTVSVAVCAEAFAMVSAVREAAIRLCLVLICILGYS
jgi:hypothetical protein